MSEGVKQFQLYESLSALVDNEASELEVHRLLAETERDEAIRTRWYRYQLVRSALQGDAVFHSASDISDSVRSAIANLSFEDEVTAGETVAVAGAGTVKVGKLKANMGRVAIAASVAFVALIGVQQYNSSGIEGQSSSPAMADATVIQQPMGQSATQQVTAAQQPIVPTIVPASNSPFAAANLQTVSRDLNGPSTVPMANSIHMVPTEQAMNDDEKVRLYLQQLMIEHAEHSAQNSNAGMLPFVRVPVER